MLCIRVFPRGPDRVGCGGVSNVGTDPGLETRSRPNIATEIVQNLELFVSFDENNWDFAPTLGSDK